jgi:hypothetical protein
VAVKEAGYSSPVITAITPASEREAVLATIITGCIQEFFAAEVGPRQTQ